MSAPASDDSVRWFDDASQTWMMRSLDSRTGRYRCYTWVRVPHPGDRDGDSVGWQFTHWEDE